MKTKTLLLPNIPVLLIYENFILINKHLQIFAVGGSVFYLAYFKASSLLKDNKDLCHTETLSQSKRNPNKQKPNTIKSLKVCCCLFFFTNI